MIISLPKSMIICLISTILIELLISWLLKARNKKDFINIILVNMLTNPLVVSLTFYINITYGLLYRNIALLILEILVIIVEGFIYKKYLNYKKIKPYLLAFILNFCSYFIGSIINYIIY